MRTLIAIIRWRVTRMYHLVAAWIVSMTGFLLPWSLHDAAEHGLGESWRQMLLGSTGIILFVAPIAWELVNARRKGTAVPWAVSPRPGQV